MFAVWVTPNGAVYENLWFCCYVRNCLDHVREVRDTWQIRFPLYNPFLNDDGEAEHPALKAYVQGTCV